MSQDEARLLLEAWNYFDSHAKEKFWEGLPGISRDEFLRLMPLVTGLENLVEAKIYLGRVAAGKLYETVPGTIIQKTQEENLPPSSIEDARRATTAVRAWLKNIKPKSAEDVAFRQVAVAQVKAELARAEEKAAPSVTEKAVPSPPPGAPEPETAAPSETLEEPVSIGIKITPAATGALQKFSARVATLPVRAAVAWSRPTLSASEPQRAAALTFWAKGISSEKLEEKAAELGAKEKERLSELVKAIKNEERIFSVQTQLLRRAFPVKDINFLLGPESGLTQAEVSVFFSPSEKGGFSAAPRRSFFGDIFNRFGQQLFGKVATNFIKGAGQKAVAGVGAKAVAEAAVTGVAAAAGPQGLLVRAAAYLATELAPRILGWIKRHAREIFGGLLVGGGLLLGGGLGLGMAAGGGLLFVGGAGLRAAAGNVGNFFSFFFTGVLLPSIGIPILVSLISIPVVVAVILFIINSGAYLVPPKAPLFTGILESPYIAVEKKASPDCLNRLDPEGKPCPPLPGEVTYEIEIKAKKGTLTNIKIGNSYQVFGKGTGTITPPQIETPQIISPTQPFRFSYKLKFERNLNDSVIYDTLTVTADAPEQKGAEASDVASVIIGNPPASSCPILGGSITTGSYNGTREVGHGSNPYWSGPAGTDCGYDIPAFSGCNSPTTAADPDENNVCQGRARACSYYGFAADVRRSGRGDIVQLPSIFGKSITWTFQRRVSIARGSWGYGYVFTGSEGGRSYSLYLGHLNQTIPPQSAPSGTVVGTLYPGLSPPHVHIELQINGQWVRPDFLCGGAGP